jgi:hypothetical protein
LGNASLILIQETQHFFIGIHNETLSVAQTGVCNRKLLSFFGFLFYVTGIVPSDGCVKQLSKGSNAEFLFRSSAVGLNGFQT